MVSRALRGGGALLAATIVAAALAGCATVPSGGPVTSGKAVHRSDPLSDPYVRLIASGPKRGWGPVTIVQGFLTASASFEHHQAVARRYLTPALRKRWRPNADVTVYDGDVGLKAAQAKQDATVRFRAAKVASISSGGEYGADKGTLDTKFHLSKVHGQWRISGLPAGAGGLLLRQEDINRAYRPLDLYFYGPHNQVLVPDPRFIPVRPRAKLATALVRALLHGPSRWLSPAVHTAFPKGTHLRTEALLSSGTVEINLRGRVAGSTQGRLQALSAQLVWTLRQLPGMQQLRLEINGKNVNVRGATGDNGMQRRGDWSQLDPAGTVGSIHAYFVRDGALWILERRQPVRALGPAGAGLVDLHDPAVSLPNEQQVAGLSAKGDQLYVGELRRGGKVGSRLTGSHLATPSWDRFGNLWVADRRNKHHSTVQVIKRNAAPGAPRLKVDIGPLAHQAIYALRVARDGCRVAVLVGTGKSSRLEIAPIVRGRRDIRLGRPHRLATELSTVSDVAWRDADTIVALGQGPRGAVQPYLVPVTGAKASAAGYAGPEARTISAAPQAPLLVGVAGGQVWSGSPDSLNWQRTVDGSDPAYPG